MLILKHNSISKLLLLIKLFSNLVNSPMRSFSLTDKLRNLDNSETDNEISTFYKTMATTGPPSIDDNLKNKIKTFSRWKLQQSLPKKKSKKDNNMLFKDNTDATPMQHLLSLIIQQSKDNQNKKNKKAIVIQELEGIKTDRRQRFKRLQNPEEIILHYAKHQNFNPSKEQEILLYRIVKLKNKLDSIQPFNLNFFLSHIFKSMNMAVDFNNTRFLILLIMMTAEVCFEAKQFKTSFFFFTQAVVASTCTRQWSIKLDALIYMGKICLQIGEYESATLFFKKALQYAWKVGERELQLRIYDLLGQSHYYQGKCSSAMYYHNRYILGEAAKKSSAVLRMSIELLKQYEKTLENTQKENLSELFIDYLRLPITNFSFYPPMKVEQIHKNYVDGESPRKNRKDVQFNYEDLPEAKIQVDKVLKQFNDFKSQIPNPDLYKNFVVSSKYGKPRKNVEFEQSLEYHKIFGVHLQEFDKSLLKFPMDQKIEKMLQEKPKPDWWEQIVTRSKKQRSQKIGGIKNKIYKRHLSCQESEKVKIENKKREAINQSLNKTILNWIDPPKKYTRQ